MEKTRPNISCPTQRDWRCLAFLSVLSSFLSCFFFLHPKFIGRRLRFQIYGSRPETDKIFCGQLPSLSSPTKMFREIRKKRILSVVVAFRESTRSKRHIFFFFSFFLSSRAEDNFLRGEILPDPPFPGSRREENSKICSSFVFRSLCGKKDRSREV